MSKVGPSPLWMRETSARERCTPNQQHRLTSPTMSCWNTDSRCMRLICRYVKGRKSDSSYDVPKTARAIMTLDGVERTLSPGEMLVISDAEKPVCRSRCNGRRIQRDHGRYGRPLCLNLPCFMGSTVQNNRQKTGHANRKHRPGIEKGIAAVEHHGFLL